MVWPVQFTQFKPSDASTCGVDAVLPRIVEHDIDELGIGARDRASLHRLAASPKHRVTEPALAMSAFGIDAEALLDGIATPQVTQRDGTLLGHLFESLVAPSVRVYAHASRERVSHLHPCGGDQHWSQGLPPPKRNRRHPRCAVRRLTQQQDEDPRSRAEQFSCTPKGPEQHSRAIWASLDAQQRII